MQITVVNDRQVKPEPFPEPLGLKKEKYHKCLEQINCETKRLQLYGGFLKWWYIPNKPIGFPTKNDQHLGCEMEGNPPFKETKGDLNPNESNAHWQLLYQ